MGDALSVSVAFTTCPSSLRPVPDVGSPSGTVLTYLCGWTFGCEDPELERRIGLVVSLEIGSDGEREREGEVSGELAMLEGPRRVVEDNSASWVSEEGAEGTVLRGGWDIPVLATRLARGLGLIPEAPPTSAGPGPGASAPGPARELVRFEAYSSVSQQSNYTNRVGKLT